MENRSRILLVDDDELTLHMLTATLEQDYVILHATDGERALALTATEAVDLVLLDVEMPGIDGYEVCRRLKETADVPVIFHSARTSIEERLQGYRVGAEDYLAKPFDPAELGAKIVRVLQQRTTRRELSGQLDEAMNAVLSTADMMGEAGVVLEFQRDANQCKTHAALAQAILAALARWAWDGCVRVRGRQRVISLNAKGDCTALEATLLDHLQTQNRGIHALGSHTGFVYGDVLVFVRNLAMNRPDGSMDRAESERMGRAIDNIALLVEGALSLVTALDAGTTARDLDEIRKLVTMTRDALTDIQARSHAQRMEVQQLAQRLNEQVEASFLHLGLTATQEDQVSGIIREHGEDVLKALDQGRELQDYLQRIVQKLGQYV
ncbi:MAG: response regulator [Ideonella sp.]|nr:response regulator [Ideonella sp.]